MASLIFPDWPQPDNVGACSTTRMGGVSLPPYDSLNLGNHVGDKSEHVERNRSLLVEYAQLPREPVWLEQIHGTEVITLDGQAVGNYQADAAYTNTPGQVCAVMTADCLPVLLCSASGDEVAAAHAGWRGLCSGILENTVSRFNAKPEMIRAWLGPAIGPEKFEVGPEVREAFIATNFDLQQAFIPYGDKYLANIYLLAKLKLQSLGITEVFGGTACTVTEERHFFSYRRDGNSGRMATLIWLR
ncbi:purine nucleoside phosphorylase YfiH [Xenorhabdus szentirmaii]|uniref:purine nucleoside phosphorylase YfiH n=1 Tax=Xenorhabdus szentirmaii TaxID=290112 RepID=UPI001995A671|nr:purine nucleoside phosphorylase YfiH [Xenorhabdus sp. 38]MBD2782233.1 polyphenol oxidase [Xenorhabdus sp. 38]